MTLLTLCVIFSVLLPAALSADSLPLSSTTCAIKSADGPYDYSPYTGKGPSKWGSLLPEYSACSAGSLQSPINFPNNVSYAPKAMGPNPMLLSAKFSAGASSSNWALSCAGEKACGKTTFKGKTYYHFNTHFHSPSEHLLGGKRFPMEVHFVHASEEGELAVIATMFEFADMGWQSEVAKMGNVDWQVNRFFADVMEGVKGEGEFLVKSPKIVEKEKGFCVYEGSLTTPPCSEGVTFFMQMHVETVSKRQVWDYMVSAGASYDGNNRPVQELNGRSVTCFV